METVPNGYCEISDLLLRNDVGIPKEVDLQKYVNDAAEEIDSTIGSLYQTPVKFNAQDKEKYRPTILLLKRINAHLATGRIIMAISSPHENNVLDAYGADLVKTSKQVLASILDRGIILEGAEVNRNPPSEYTTSRAYIMNLDPESSVEAFYKIVDPPMPSSGIPRGMFRGLW